MALIAIWQPEVHSERFPSDIVMSASGIWLSVSEDSSNFKLVKVL